MPTLNMPALNISRKLIGSFAAMAPVLIALLTNPAPAVELNLTCLSIQVNPLTSRRAINAPDLLPRNGNYNHYKGSLTTLPCSKGVSRFVLTKLIQISVAQIRTFSGIVGENAPSAIHLQSSDHQQKNRTIETLEKIR